MGSRCAILNSNVKAAGTAHIDVLPAHVAQEMAGLYWLQCTSLCGAYITSSRGLLMDRFAWICCQEYHRQCCTDSASLYLLPTAQEERCRATFLPAVAVVNGTRTVKACTLLAWLFREQRASPPHSAAAPRLEVVTLVILPVPLLFVGNHQNERGTLLVTLSTKLMRRKLSICAYILVKSGSSTQRHPMEWGAKRTNTTRLFLFCSAGWQLEKV